MAGKGTGVKIQSGDARDDEREPTASQKIIDAAASKVGEVDDALGRKLKFRKLGALQKYDLAKLVGDKSSVPAVMGPAAIAYAVVAIDGVPLGIPQTEIALRARIGELDDEGLDAVADAMVERGWFKREETISGDDLKNS